MLKLRRLLLKLKQAVRAYKPVIEKYWGEADPNRKLGFIDDFNFSKPKEALDTVLTALGFESHLKTEVRKDNSWKLKSLAPINHLIPAMVIKLKKITKFRDFFVEHQYKEVAHTNFNNAGTVTGRLTSSDPNLQNIPKGTLNFDVSGDVVNDYEELRSTAAR